jgi:hypothetical protein
MKLAESIGIDRSGLIIDGRRLPYWLAVEDVEVRSGELDIPSIRITLLAESIHIDPLLDVETDGDVRLVSLESEAADNE